MAMAAARRMSLAPVNRSTNLHNRQMSWRSGSMFWPRTPFAQGSKPVILDLYCSGCCGNLFWLWVALNIKWLISSVWIKLPVYILAIMLFINHGLFSQVYVNLY